MRAIIPVALAILLAAPGGPARADAPPVPKIYKGLAGAEKGQWRMEILEAERAGREAPMGRMGAITLCTENLLKPHESEQGHPGRSDCKYQLEKDTADEAIIHATCPDSTSRVQLTRESAKSVLMQIEHKGKSGESAMKARYTYLGACREGQGAMSLDKDSPACEQMQARAADMDPDKACANAGAQHDQCLARMRAAMQQMQAMCK
ncbi:MAG: hypothetical protein ACREVQ_08025 [Burkholderiales bacterium]